MWRRDGCGEKAMLYPLEQFRSPGIVLKSEGRAVRMLRIGLCAAVVAMALDASRAEAQETPGQPGSGAQQTFTVTSKLVLLDVTVLDKKGHPVTTGLTKDDFLITEDKRPQQIFSFEMPQAHAVEERGQDTGAAAPLNILVLDQLNSKIEDFAYIRHEAQKFLESQPKELRSPAELMVVGNRSLEMVQGWTRDRDEMLAALGQVRSDIPFKEMRSDFWTERIGQSLDALQQIAIENAGVPGRKNIIWLGFGAPALLTGNMPVQNRDAVERYIHAAVNLMVESRVSLYLIYPGLPPTGWVSVPAGNADQVENLNSSQSLAGYDPFGGDINFGLFAPDTGGRLFYNRDDLDGELKESEELGSDYYTLTYQPHGGDDDGRFRRIRVTMRDPNLRAVTRDGYYAADKNAPLDARMEAMHRLAEAERTPVTFATLPVAVSNIVRHPDAESADFTVRLPAGSLTWSAGPDGNSTTNLMVATAGLNGDRAILSAKVAQLTAATRTQDTQHLEGRTIAFRLTVRVPKKAQFVRVAIETEGGGKVGTAELNRGEIDAAPLS